MLSNDSSRLFEFQNKSFCLHNLSVCTVYIYYVYICKTYIKQIKYIFHLVKKVVSRFWTDKSGNNHTDRHLYKVKRLFCLIIPLNLRWFAGFPPTSLRGAALTSRLLYTFTVSKSSCIVQRKALRLKARLYVKGVLLSKATVEAVM